VVLVGVVFGWGKSSWCTSRQAAIRSIRCYQARTQKVSWRPVPLRGPSCTHARIARGPRPHARTSAPARVVCGWASPVTMMPRPSSVRAPAASEPRSSATSTRRTHAPAAAALASHARPTYPTRKSATREAVTNRISARARASACDARVFLKASLKPQPRDRPGPRLLTSHAQAGAFLRSPRDAHQTRSHSIRAAIALAASAMGWSRTAPAHVSAFCQQRSRLCARRAPRSWPPNLGAPLATPPRHLSWAPNPAARSAISCRSLRWRQPIC